MKNERNMYCSIDLTNNRANYLPIAQTQSVSTFQPFSKYIRFAISLLTRRYSKVLQFLYRTYKFLHCSHSTNHKVKCYG